MSDPPLPSSLPSSRPLPSSLPYSQQSSSSSSSASSSSSSSGSSSNRTSSGGGGAGSGSGSGSDSSGGGDGGRGEEREEDEDTNGEVRSSYNNQSSGYDDDYNIVEEDKDLFASDNEEYVKTPISSPFPVPASELVSGLESGVP